jgi:hypothetical protein
MAAFVGVGFYMGYDGSPDCEAADVVYKDVDVWRSFARSRIAAAPLPAPEVAPVPAEVPVQAGWEVQPDPAAYPPQEYPQPQYPQPEQAEYDLWQTEGTTDSAAVATYPVDPYYAPAPQYP